MTFDPRVAKSLANLNEISEMDVNATPETLVIGTRDSGDGSQKRARLGLHVQADCHTDIKSKYSSIGE